MRPSEAAIAEAKAIRAKADKKYTNLHKVQDGRDYRYIGHLGERAFKSWVFGQVEPLRWIEENPIGNPDFMIGPHGIEVKTSKLPQSPLPAPWKGYADPVMSERHIETKSEYFFFQAFTDNPVLIWLLGGISVAEFRQHARLVKKGDAINPKFVAPWNLWVIGLDKLLPPLSWLMEFENELC